jgi:hypothetical protein
LGQRVPLIGQIAKDGQMTFLFRMAFWLGLVILLLPGPLVRPGVPSPSTNGSQALAAKSTGADRPPSCPRQLDACAENLQAFVKLCRDVYRFLSDRGGQSAIRSANDAANPSRDTLTPADLAAPWRGSPPRKEHATKRSI